MEVVLGKEKLEPGDTTYNEFNCGANAIRTGTVLAGSSIPPVFWNFWTTLPETLLRYGIVPTNQTTTATAKTINPSARRYRVAPARFLLDAAPEDADKAFCAVFI
jgi:phage terminase large subunit-like protein